MKGKARKMKELKQRKNVTGKDVEFLASLPEEEVQQISESLSTEQKEQIYQFLCTPKTPSWITETVKVHSMTPDLKFGLPMVPDKKDIKKIIEMMMIAAGDFHIPNPESIKIVHDYVRSFLQELSHLSKKKLDNQFAAVLRKYKKSAKYTEYISEDDKSVNSEDGIDIKDVERLQFNDIRTNSMTEKEYLKFSECRKTNLLKLGKEKFCSWIGCKKNYKTLSWIGREKIFQTIENANRKKNNGELKVLETAITKDELFFD
jgi:hypothetical protein